MADSVQLHGRQPTRLPRPWDSPGKNTGVGCHFLLQCMKVKSESEVAQSCPTLTNPMDCSLPGSSVHGIFQARVLEWGAIAFSVCTAHPLKKKPAQESLLALANGLNKGTAWQKLWSDPYPDPQKSRGNLAFHIYQAGKILSKPQFSCCWDGVIKGRVGSRTLIFTEH